MTVSVADEVKPPSGLVVKTSPPGRVTTVGSTGRENWRLEEDWMSIEFFRWAPSMKNLLVLDLGGRGSGDETSSEESGLHFVWLVVFVFRFI